MSRLINHFFDLQLDKTPSPKNRNRLFDLRNASFLQTLSAAVFSYSSGNFQLICTLFSMINRTLVTQVFNIVYTTRAHISNEHVIHIIYGVETKTRKSYSRLFFTHLFRFFFPQSKNSMITILSFRVYYFENKMIKE